MGNASLRSLLESTPQRRGGIKCRTCSLLGDLDDDDRAALLEYLSSDVSSRTIVDALTSYGVKTSVSAIARHRRECKPLD